MCVGLMMQASKQLPTCIGVPVFLELKPDVWLSWMAELWRKLMPSIVRAEFLPIKTVRVIMAFMVAQFDYAAPAYLFREQWLRELQLIINRIFCEAHGLSIREAKLFSYLPPQWGGMGCPWLPLQAELQYLHQVLKMPYSRSGLSQMVATEQLDKDTPGEDVQQPWRVLRAFKIVLMTERGVPLSRPVVPSGGDDEPCLVVTDEG